MVKSNGNKKINTAIFISGRGSNFLNLAKFAKSKNSPIQIIYVISDNVNSKGLNYAKKFNIKKKIFKFSKLKKEDDGIVVFLKKNRIKLICLAGFMKVLSKNFINKFNGKIINIHPSLLPKYKGLNTHQRAIENKDKYSGCTVHFVNSKLDSGKIILQKKVKIYNKETSRSLAKKVLKIEHSLYPKAILKIAPNL